MCCGGLTLLLPFGATRDGNSCAGRSQGLCQQIFATLTGCAIQVSHSAPRRAAWDAGYADRPRVAASRCSGDRQETIDAGDSPRMGLISYRRAGVAQRQARAAVRAPHRIGDALNDIQAQNEQLNELVNQPAEMIEPRRRVAAASLSAAMAGREAWRPRECADPDAGRPRAAALRTAARRRRAQGAAAAR